MKARYKTVVDRLAAAIRCGELAPGHRLPTHRELAAAERMSLATATRVYAELEAMGFVSGETGRGTFVREITLPPGLGIDQSSVAADMLDLNFNYLSLPDQGALLRDALRQLAGKGDIEALLRHQPHGGKPHERASVAGYLARIGLPSAAEEVVLVNGAQQGLAIAVMTLLKPGDVVAVDALTYPGFKILAESFHFEIVPIPVTPQGSDLDALRHLCASRAIKAVYTMPTVHNPLGWVMDQAARLQLAAIARQYNLMIIEDGAYAFLADGAPPPLAACAPERTLYITGFSKNVAAGLRVGAVKAPADRIPALERAIRATTWNTPALMTNIVCQWIEDGTLARLEAIKRQDARLRHTIARSALGNLACIANPDAYFLWLPLAEGVRTEQVVMALAQQKISVSAAAPFATTRQVPHAIRLAFGAIDIDQLQATIHRVHEAILWHSDL